MSAAVSTSSQLKITVVVPIYQQWQLAIQLFEHLQQQSLPHSYWEVLAVDNGSDNVPQAHRLPSFVKLLHCTKPGSYAARNAAVDHAKGELLIFTDADCRPCEGWLKAHWEAYQRYGKRQLNAGAVVVEKLTDTAPNIYELYDILLGIPQKRYAQQRGFGVTANLAVPAVVFQQVGPFDGQRFSGGDAEFCRRAQRYDIRLGYIDTARVIHPPRATWADLAAKTRRIKAAQVLHGPLRWRLINILRAFLPPQHALRVLAKAPVSWQQKASLMAIALRLRGVEILELLRLLRGAAPQRV